MTTATRQGFLVLADITGFTPFVASTELEHSQEILNHVLKGIISFLTPTFTLAEVEGDAVFVYSGLEKFPRGEMILEIIESAYYAFRDKKNSFRRVRSCECKACQMAPLLDLKFIVHYGDYVMNNIGGKSKPLGPSVNVAHRLLKNHVTEETGCKAYALFTKDCVDTIQIDSTKLHQQTEEYEHIGAIETFSIDLDEEYKKFLNERRVYLSAEDADFVVQKDFPIPPPLLWEWVNDPKRRSLWNEETNWRPGLRPEGRTGKGATNHCVSTDVTEKILDYHPFDYYTSSIGKGPLSLTLTSKFEEIPSGTRLYWHVKLNGFLPKVMTRYLCKQALEKGLKIHQAFNTLHQLIEAEKLNDEVSF